MSRCFWGCAITLLALVVTSNVWAGAETDDPPPLLCTFLTPDEIATSTPTEVVRAFGAQVESGTAGASGLSNNVECVWRDVSGLVSLDWMTGREAYRAARKDLADHHHVPVLNTDPWTAVYSASDELDSEVWAFLDPDKIVLHLTRGEWDGEPLDVTTERLVALARIATPRALESLRGLPPLSAGPRAPSVRVQSRIVGIRGDDVYVDERTRTNDRARCYDLTIGPDPRWLEETSGADPVVRLVDPTTGREVARSGRLVGTTTQERSSDSVNCLLEGTIKRFPKVDRVRVWIGEEQGPDYTYDELRRDGWTISLEQG